MANDTPEQGGPKVKDTRASASMPPAGPPRTDLVAADEGPRRDPGPSALIQAALDQKAPIETLERLYNLKVKYEQDEARKAYVKAMAEFKRNPPELLKTKLVRFRTDKGVTEYNHADLGIITPVIIEALAQVGFSHRWSEERKEDRIYVTCILTHELGHSESITMDGAADTSGGKNPIQAWASTRSYLQRYSLLAITGLAAKDVDDDGKGADETNKFVNAEELAVLEKLAKDSGANVSKFLDWLNRTYKCAAKELKEIPAKLFKEAKAELEAAAARKGGSGKGSAKKVETPPPATTPAPEKSGQQGAQEGDDDYSFLDKK